MNTENGEQGKMVSQIMGNRVVSQEWPTSCALLHAKIHQRVCVHKTGTSTQVLTVC
jgi:hypothetical protein